MSTEVFINITYLNSSLGIESLYDGILLSPTCKTIVNVIMLTYDKFMSTCKIHVIMFT